MNLESYPYIGDKIKYRHRYAFISSGVKENVKIVEFDKIDLTYNGLTVYNLSFGDLDADSLEISYENKSANGDVKIVLTTIAHIVYDFTTKNKDCYIAFYGMMKFGIEYIE